MEDKIFKKTRAVFSNQELSRTPVAKTDATSRAAAPKVANPAGPSQAAVPKVASPTPVKKPVASKPAGTSLNDDFFDDSGLSDDIINSLIPNSPEKKPDVSVDAKSDPKAKKEPKAKKAPKNKVSSSKKKRGLLYGCGALILAAIIVIAIVVINNNSSNNEPAGDEEFGESLSVVDGPTEEENQVTKETLDKYTEVTIEGYKDGDESQYENGAVAVSVRNTSNEAVSLEIVIAATDDKGNVLETTSLYAENVGPGETNYFEVFTTSTLTADQLRSAKYKVFKASTYESAAVPSDENVEPAQESEPEISE